MTIINGAFGLAFDTDNNVLLAQRFEPEEPLFHLKWGFPGGGQEFGEHLTETMQRELKEELGIEYVDIVTSQPLCSVSIWGEGEQRVHVNLFVYVVSIGNQVPFINDDETNDWRWFSLEEALELDCLPSVHSIIQEAILLKEKSNN